MLLGTAGCGPDEGKPETLLFILAGQSNMSGRGALDQLPPNFPANAGSIKNFGNADVWTEAAEPLDDPRGQKDACSLDLSPGVGPGAAFAQRLTELLPAVHVGLIPCARGRVTLDEWTPKHPAEHPLRLQPAPGPPGPEKGPLERSAFLSG